MANKESKENRQEKLMSYFERSAARVTQAFDRLDKGFVQPGTAAAMKSFSEQPVRSTFLATFAILSFLPLLSFVGFSLFALGACTFFALAAALVVSSAAIAFVGFWLAATLTVLFFVSLFLTNAVVGSYLIVRYVSLVRAGGARAGSIEWAREVKKRVRGEPIKVKSSGVQQIKQEEAEKHAFADAEEQEDHHDDARSDGSAIDDTTVVIGEQSPDRKKWLRDLEGPESPVLMKREFPGMAALDMPVDPSDEELRQNQVVDAF